MTKNNKLHRMGSVASAALALLLAGPSAVAQTTSPDTSPGALEISMENGTPVLELPSGPPSAHLVETSGDLESWEPWIYGMTPGGRVVLPRPQAGAAAWFRTRLVEEAADGCAMWDQSRTTLTALMDGMQVGCTTWGEPDVPAIRDAFIPGPDTPVKTVRLRFHLMAANDGSNPASSLAQVTRMVAAANQQFGPHRIQFTHTARIVNASAFRSVPVNALNAMKRAHAESPATQINIFVTTLNGASGIGTFPWSSDALTETGGIVIADEAAGVFVPDSTTLGHEIGHCLGLWHTHHGVAEVQSCSACYETPGGSERDLTGDYCSDTPATPRLWDCLHPPGKDPCSNRAWGQVDLANIMSYSSCREHFTPQQAGRMHAWIEHRLGTWLTGPAAGGPPAPSNLQAVATTGGVRVTWQDNSSDESGFELQKSLDGVVFGALTVSAANGVTYTDNSVAAGVTTWYRVRTQRGTERSAWANGAPVVRPGTTAPPAAPTRLVLSPPSPPGRPGVRLQWHDNSIDETGFEVQRAPAGGTFAALVTAPAADYGLGFYDDNAITLGNAYTYRLRAMKGTLRSAWTEEVTVHTLAAVLPAPTAVSLSITSAGGIRVEWTDNSASETGFEIQRSPNGVNWSLLTTAPANNDEKARIVDNAVTPGQAYWYRVQAVLGTLGSGWSASRVASAPPAPAAPSGVSLSVTSENGIRVQWTDNSADETGFEIQRSADGGAYGVIGFGPANADATARLVDKEVSSGHTYAYRVRALRGVLSSALSPAASLTLAAAPLTAPVLTSPANARPDAPRAPLFQWNGVAGAVSWQLEIVNLRTGNVTRSYPNGGTVPAITSTSFQMPAADHLRSGQDLTWRVRGLDAAGNPGAWSSSFAFTTRVETPTLAVLLTPANGAGAVSVTPLLDWDADDDATHHYVQIRKDSPGGELVLNVGPYAGSSFYQVATAEALISEKVYFWRVKDSTTAGASDWTGWFSFTTVQLPPSNAPVPLNPSAGESTIVTRPFFKWEALTRASSYRLRVIRASNGTVAKNYSGIVGTEFRAEAGDGLDSNTDYLWEIRGENDAGPGPWCTRVAFHTRP